MTFPMQKEKEKKPSCHLLLKKHININFIRVRAITLAMTTNYHVAINKNHAGKW